MSDAIVPVSVQNVLDMDVIRLSLWSIKFTANNIKLEGFVRNQEGSMLQKVCSENICRRMMSTLLFDISGKFYELVGQIDREFQVRNGMPTRVVEEFLNGLPENWVFLISTCLTTEQRSAIRPIQATPTQPLRQKEPIVTLADETEMNGDRTVAKVDSENERRKQLEEKEREEAERKRKEEEDAANYTFRAPKPLGNDAITPIRFTRGVAGSQGPRSFKVFDQLTPKVTNGAPLASSTPQQAPPPVKEPPKPKTSLTNDSDLFAVPKLPQPSTSMASPDRLSFLDEMDKLFNTAKIDKTPVIETRRKPIFRPRFERESSPPDQRGQCSSRQAYEMDYNRESYRYDDDRSRMSRKRGYYRSPESRDYYEYNPRREEEYRYQDEYRYDSKRCRPRENSSSSGRSVRFDDRHHHPREMLRDQRDREMYELQKLKDLERREKKLEAMLRAKTGRRVSSDDTADDSMSLEEEWERENQEILDNSMVVERRNVPRKKTAKPPKKPAQKPPPRAAPKKNKREPIESDDLNESIATSRPRRTCSTPATPVPKRITWPKRDLDKLRHVIELKKPTANLEDWVEVTRLLKKNGVEAADVKLAAETRLKWKEPTAQNAEALEEEVEEERKRRRGVAAKVKEGVRMREEMREGGGRSDELQNTVASVEDYQPDDMDADQSLLALGTPAVAKKKGGTRASIMPQPVEDSPLVRGNNTSSFLNSPKLDSTKAKEVETTLRYVQHLSTIQARPGSSMNNKSYSSKSFMNQSTSRGKNTSISVEQGTRKAMKMINRGTAIEEEDDEEEEEEEEEEDASIY